VVVGESLRLGMARQVEAITFRFEEQGVAPGAAQVTVRRAGEAIESRSVRVGQPVSVNVQIPHAGPNIVEIEASPLDNEITTVNNRAVDSIDRVRDKLRALLISGEPAAGERTSPHHLTTATELHPVH